MKPDEAFAKQGVLEEQQRVQATERKLTENSKTQIRQDCANLRRRQEERENVDVLPKIDLADIPLTRPYPVYHKTKLANGVPVWQFNQPTNGIAHIRIKFDVNSLPEPLKKYLPLCSE